MNQAGASSLAMLPWFPGDFMRSTRGWSVTEKGVYRELLDAQWDMGDLPLDPEDLRKTIGATPAEWESGWKRCESKFPVKRTARRNWRLEAHRSRSAQIANARSENGRKGGQASVEARAKQRLSKGSSRAKATVNYPVLSSPIQSNPYQSIPREFQNTTAAAQPTVPIEFEDLKMIYPKRSGANPWDRALKACRARLKGGATWNEMLEGARRYQDYCRETRKLDTEFVMQAATFFGPSKHFSEPWGLPANKAETLRDANLEASKEWLHASNG